MSPPSLALIFCLSQTQTDWNTRFQTLLAKEDSLEKFRDLAALAKDFVHLAEVYGRIIISEYFLKPDEMTIKPTKLGGIAGGRKYICQGIIFKFALDTMVQLLPPSSPSLTPPDLSELLHVRRQEGCEQ